MGWLGGARTQSRTARARTPDVLPWRAVDRPRARLHVPLVTPDVENVAEAELTAKLRHLRELIAALDRRVPRVERVGEVSIAREAAALREKALQRIAILEAKLGAAVRS